MYCAQVSCSLYDPIIYIEQQVICYEHSTQAIGLYIIRGTSASWGPNRLLFVDKDDTRKHQLYFRHSRTNPKIRQSSVQVIRWFAGMPEQGTHRPSILCSKYYFFFSQFLTKSFPIIVLIYFFIIKKSFECPKSKRNNEKKCL